MRSERPGLQGAQSVLGNALQSLGELWWRAGNPAKALPYLQRAEAKPYLRKALELAESRGTGTPVSFAEAAFEYAKLLRATGREAQARELEDRARSSSGTGSMK